MVDGEVVVFEGAAAFGGTHVERDAGFGEAGGFELVEEVARVVVLACYTKMEQFEGGAGFGAGYARALWLLVAF